MKGGNLGFSAVAAVVAFAFTQLAGAQAVQIRDATGALVGLYGGPAGYDAAPGLPSASGSAFRVISSTGYAFSIGTGSGVVLYGREAHPAYGGGINGQIATSLSYLTVDCSGPAYLVIAPAGLTDQITGGVAFRVAQGPIFYTPKSAIAGARTIRSSGLPVVGQCSADTPTERMTLPAFPNDPATTGVSNVPFVPPLTLGLADTPWLLLRDSFESQVG
jgi:hypothetical protein